MLPADLILASSSPYRRELLMRLRLPFRCISPDVDESPQPAERPAAMAARLAQLKAMAVAKAQPQAVIVGSDQVAALDQYILGKPGNHANALCQLQTMRGRSVIFYTAVCVIDNRHPALPMQLTTVDTLVHFRNLPDAQLNAYLQLEQPYDCAGSAKNEGLGITLIERIESTDPTALTGLPLIALSTMLYQLGYSFF